MYYLLNIYLIIIPTTNLLRGDDLYYKLIISTDRGIQIDVLAHTKLYISKCRGLNIYSLFNIYRLVSNKILSKNSIFYSSVATMLPDLYKYILCMLYMIISIIYKMNNI